MEANYSYYDFNKSIERVDEVLDGSDASYEDKKSIPLRSSLTFNNGYYVDCSAIFIDIRGSKDLNEKHTRPVLAKIYKTYISELIAVLKSHLKINELYIEGDAVWGICDTPKKKDVDELFSVGAKASSLIDILNIKYKKKGYSELTVGIGISYGSSLMIKSGYKGSGINEVVWLGKLVGEAAKLCSYGNKTYSDSEMMVSNVFYDNLNDTYKKLLSKNYERDCYHGCVINLSMNEWVENNG
ncbi:adenylate/guanylate cyclase domain-containing protein [uncultured Cocleimonas sp.]|uniref:adenylate/guanylate cyclase domain-containing protein n=1 Tax=uncultured Cocleimonas sp. TaxID=1051587 RepID=UPI0026363D98|nr:adenylate/guanylate cyclase domain-containing protein [uncultured Cocleimonas sp.]